MRETRPLIPPVWYRWLFLVILGVMAFGISMVLVPGWMRQFFSLLLYASPTAIKANFGSAANAYIALIHGVLGTVMFGWGAAMLIVLRGPFRRLEPDGWRLIALPMVAWFVPDTAFSLYIGFWQNAAFNSAFAVLFAIPLVATRTLFVSRAPNISFKANDP